MPFTSSSILTLNSLWAFNCPNMRYIYYAHSNGSTHIWEWHSMRGTSAMALRCHAPQKNAPPRRPIWEMHLQQCLSFDNEDEEVGGCSAQCLLKICSIIGLYCVFIKVIYYILQSQFSFNLMADFDIPLTFFIKYFYQEWISHLSKTRGALNHKD